MAMASQRMGVIASFRKKPGHQGRPHGIEIEQDHGADDFGVQHRKGIEKLGEPHGRGR